MGNIEHWPLEILVCDRCGEVYEDEQGCDCGVAAGRPQRVEVVPAATHRRLLDDYAELADGIEKREEELERAKASAESSATVAMNYRRDRDEARVQIEQLKADRDAAYQAGYDAGVGRKM